MISNEFNLRRKIIIRKTKSFAIKFLAYLIPLSLLVSLGLLALSAVSSSF